MTCLDCKCWVVEAFGISGRIFAKRRSRASMMTALALKDSGYVRSIGEAFREMKIRREPVYDADAMMCGREAWRP